MRPATSSEAGVGSILLVFPWPDDPDQFQCTCSATLARNRADTRLFHSALFRVELALTDRRRWHPRWPGAYPRLDCGEKQSLAVAANRSAERFNIVDHVIRAQRSFSGDTMHRFMDLGISEIGIGYPRDAVQSSPAVLAAVKPAST